MIQKLQCSVNKFTRSIFIVKENDVISVEQLFKIDNCLRIFY